MFCTQDFKSVGIFKPYYYQKSSNEKTAMGFARRRSFLFGGRYLRVADPPALFAGIRWK